MIEILSNTIQTTLNSFDFAYCIIVNVLTYIIVKVITDVIHKNLTKWNKRIVLVGVILSIGVLYYFVGNNITTLINSAILAPVFWSWVMKPICSYFNIDYKQIET